MISAHPPYATHTLCKHPATNGPADLQLDVQLSLAATADRAPGLVLTYRLSGDLTQVRLPAPALPTPTDGLWQHTCFEAFASRDGDNSYREFNFSPSGQWAAYRFSDQRLRDPLAEAAATPWTPGIQTEQAPGQLTLRAWLPLQALPPLSGEGAWLLGLTAVIEGTDGQLSYWALQHPGERPDFHHRGGWRPSRLPSEPIPTDLQRP